MEAMRARVSAYRTVSCVPDVHARSRSPPLGAGGQARARGGKKAAAKAKRRIEYPPVSLFGGQTAARHAQYIQRRPHLLEGVLALVRRIIAPTETSESEVNLPVQISSALLTAGGAGCFKRFDTMYLRN